jgi:pyruvate dehydrogenase E2 component (dihydrolipoyllysine-residue acetyltransferase)
MPRRIVMPSFGMYTVEGTLVTWLQPADADVAEGQPIVEIETDKATQEVVAPAAGRLHHVAAEGDHVKEEDLLGYILRDGEEAPEVTTAEPVDIADDLPAEPSAQAAGVTISPTPVAATPVARRLAVQHGIDLAQLAGSGPGGRIIEADVQAALARPDVAQAALLALSGHRIRERVPLSGMRKAIGERLRHSLTEAVSLTLTREIDAERLVAARQQLNDRLSLSIPFDAFFAKFLSAELRKQPELNVILSDASLLRLEDAHVGIAVDVPGGLVVPVVRNPEIEPLGALAQTIHELVERARSSTLRAADLEGASSTISNLGGYGVDAFTPILNPPQSSILGIGRIQPRAVVHAGAVVIAQTCVFSLTFDHRVADGAAAARLLDGIGRRMNDESYLAELG